MARRRESDRGRMSASRHRALASTRVYVSYAPGRVTGGMMRRFAAIGAAGLLLLANAAIEPVSAQKAPQSDRGDDHDCDDFPQQPNRDKTGVNAGYNCAQIT